MAFDIYYGNASIPLFMKISKNLLDAYKETEYHVSLMSGDIVLRIGQSSLGIKQLLESHSVCGAVFVTAYNPFGKVLSDDENSSANELLRADLLNRYETVYSGYGSSQDGGWKEASYLALPASLPDAERLCQQYSQNAVVYVDSRAIPELILHPKYNT